MLEPVVNSQGHSKKQRWHKQRLLMAIAMAFVMTKQQVFLVINI
jgi:hypothetical protein